MPQPRSCLPKKMEIEVKSGLRTKQLSSVSQISKIHIIDFLLQRGVRATCVVGNNGVMAGVAREHVPP